MMATGGMFWKEYKGWRLDGAHGQDQDCPNCGNTTEHFVYVLPHGLQFGFVFFKRPLVGKRKYYLACSACGRLSQELAKEQVFSVKG